MPTYGYACTKCEAKFDVFHSMKCTDTQYCPTCGGAGKKLLSGASIIFKGSGFYSTDYRDSGYVEAQKRDTSSSSSSSSSTASSSGSSSSSSDASTAPATATPAASPAPAAAPAATSSSTGSTSTGTVAKAA